MSLLKQFFMTALLVLTSGMLFAQAELNKSLIPPAPDAASLGKYGIQPVTLYEGMPNTSIPVYELKSSRLSVPVTLGYNYNGYRPGEESSWIGLGWSLQAGGVITRMVKGLVDGQPGVTHQWQDYANVMDISDKQDYLKLLPQRQLDAEPDLYTYSFNGHAGKFILVRGRAFTFPHQDLQITQVGAGFSIVAEDGTIYNFNTVETTTENPNNGTYTPQYTSAWDLSSIISSDHTDEIDFQYTAWSHRQYNYNSSETLTIPIGSSGPGTNNVQSTWTVNNYIGAMITTQRLTQITGKNCVIQFVPETTQRLDLQGSTSAYALKEVNVYSMPGMVLMKKMGLTHDYFMGTTYAGPYGQTQLKLVSVSLSGYLPSNATTPDVSIPTYYSFQYANEVNGNFPKSTKGIDKYGFYNGKDYNPSLFDASIIRPGVIVPVSPGDRSVDAGYSSNGVMTRINYPTGGYTTFDYEANKLKMPGSGPVEQSQNTRLNVPFNPALGNPTTGSQPLVINEEQDITITYERDISNYPNGIINAVPIVKIYIPGNDNNPPVPPVLIFTSPRLGNPMNAGSQTFHIMPGTYYYIVSCESTSISTTATIFYKTLIQPPTGGFTTDGPGMRIRQISSYDGINNATPAFTKNYSYLPAIPISLEGYGYSNTHYISLVNGCNPYDYSVDTYTSSYSSSLFSLASNQFYYPEVTELNDAAGVLGKTVYDYAGDGISAMGVNLIGQSDYTYNASSNTYILNKQKTNTYTGRPGINFTGFSYYVSDQVNNSGCLSGLALPNPAEPYDIVARVILYKARPYTLLGDRFQLSATDEIENDQNGNNPQTVHTDYYYDNDNYSQPSRTVVKNSKGEVITTQINYPYDCGVNPLVNSTCSFPAFQEHWFGVKRDAASADYQSCLAQRNSAAAAAVAAYNPPISNFSNPLLIAIMNQSQPQYQCENNYPGQFTTELASIGSVPCPAQNGYTDAGVAAMQSYHILTTPVEKIVSINKSGTEYLLQANRTAFTTNGAYAVSPQTIYQTEYTGTRPLKSAFLASPSTYYQPRVNFTYNAQNNLIEQSKVNEAKIAYLWGYQNMYPVAEVTGASNATISSLIIQANLDNPANDQAVRDEINKVRIGLAGTSAQVKTYSYAPQVGITSQTDANNKTTFYQYDGLTRLRVIKDKDNNVLKKFCYNYAGQPENCTSSTSTCTNTTPNWQNTTTALRCQQGACGNTGYQEQEQKDINPCSPSYNQTQWVSAGYNPTACGITYGAANWQNTTTPLRCQVGSNGQYTGYQEQEQKDINPCSATYNQTQWVTAGYNPTLCSGSQTMIALTSTNIAAGTGYVASYLNNATGITYNLPVSAAAGLQALGSIPAGTYTLTISTTAANPPVGIFYSGCAKKSISGASATFFSVPVSSTGCVSIKIDMSVAP